MRPTRSGVRPAQVIVVAALLVAPMGFAAAGPALAAARTARYIVADRTASNSSHARADVRHVHGRVVESLNAADGVLAVLSKPQAAALARLPGVTVTRDVTVKMAAMPATTAGARAPAAVYPQQTGATRLWSQGQGGAGVDVAVLDTGIDPLPDFSGRLLPGVDLSGEGNPEKDSYGHGTFVAGLIAGDGASSGGMYKGEAPTAGLVPVKVAGRSGSTDLATVIAGVGWVIAHHTSENIRVLNMALGYIPTESTVLNPLDQAVERAWDAGVAVVASAGNEGPYDGTVLSPGDDPLVITVGAVDDHGSVSPADDTMLAFSSAGPTDPDGWFKPDLVTSGRSVVSLAAPGSTVAKQNPSAYVGAHNFVGSGTSFSAAITSGAAALLLAVHPNLRPDDLKAALLGTADPGPVGNPFVDGHGLLDVAAAAAAGGIQLSQVAGQLDLTQPTPGGLTVINPGSDVHVGYSLTMPGRHAAATTWMTGGQLNIPVTCQPHGSIVGDVSVTVPEAAYRLAADSNAGEPASNSYQGTGAAPDLCGTDPMYPATDSDGQVSFTGSLMSTDVTDPVQVRFGYRIDDSSLSIQGPTSAVVPVAIGHMGEKVGLGRSWDDSTWNPANWRGRPAADQSSSAGDGSTWNGATWNGSAWNGAAWNSHSWSGHAWNGSSWNGHAWNGSAWNGHAWNGYAWGPTSGGGSGSTATPPSVTGSSPYPGYQLVSTSPDLWCPVGVQLGHPGQSVPASGHPGDGAPGDGGMPGCGSNGGDGGHGGNGDPQGGTGGAGGAGGAGGCPPSSDAQMAAGRFPCNGNGSSGGHGGDGGNATGTVPGGDGGTGGHGGDAQGAAGGNGGNGGTAQSGVAGGVGGAGGTGGGCVLYSASYWVSCAAHGGHGGSGGRGAPGHRGGAGGSGGSAEATQNSDGSNGGNGGDATPTADGARGKPGVAA